MRQLWCAWRNSFGKMQRINAAELAMDPEAQGWTHDQTRDRNTKYAYGPSSGPKIDERIERTRTRSRPARRLQPRAFKRCRV